MGLRRAWMAVASALAPLVLACSSTTASAPAKPDAGLPASCVRPAFDLAVFAYVPVERFVGACTSAELDAFADACADDPSGHACGAFLGGAPSCARCLLGDRYAGVVRKDSYGRTEISAGACGQAATDEVVDAAADVAIGGCGASLENAGACVAASCGECYQRDAGDGSCAKEALDDVCDARDPALAICLGAGASACVLGTPRDRARAIAAAVCGP